MIQRTRFAFKVMAIALMVMVVVVEYMGYTNINSCMTMRYITNNHNKWVGKSCTKLFAQVYLK